MACFVRGSSDFRAWKCGMIKDREDFIVRERKEEQRRKKTQELRKIREKGQMRRGKEYGVE